MFRLAKAEVEGSLRVHASTHALAEEGTPLRHPKTVTS